MLFQSSPPWEGRQDSIRAMVRRSSFNPRPRGRGDSEYGRPSPPRLLFQSSPPWEGRPRAASPPTARSPFQSSPPWEGRRQQRGVRNRAGRVSILAPVGGATARPTASRGSSCSFNPRPRGRGDALRTHGRPRTVRSFNPRPRGRGDIMLMDTVDAWVQFQSSPPWEGRLAAPVGICDGKRFNPRPRGRGDRIAAGTWGGASAFQSSPPWEGRRRANGRWEDRREFQSSPPWEGRRGHVNHQLAESAFQSSPPWEGRRRFACLKIVKDGCFNPRPRGRGDRSSAPLPHAARVSILAPVGGATPNGARPPYGVGCFNPRPRGRGDPSGPSTSRPQTCFNPRPRGRGDSAQGVRASTPQCFNPRPRGRGDNPPRHQRNAIWRVSILAPVGGATSSAAEQPIRASSFQSSPPWEGRPATPRRPPACRRVSILAPVGGATRPTFTPVCASSSFNPRPRGRGDT